MFDWVRQISCGSCHSATTDAADKDAADCPCEIAGDDESVRLPSAPSATRHNTGSRNRKLDPGVHGSSPGGEQSDKESNEAPFLSDNRLLNGSLYGSSGSQRDAIATLAEDMKRRMESMAADSPEESAAKQQSGPEGTVVVENVYEFYDTQTKRKRVHRMTAGERLSSNPTLEYMSVTSNGSLVRSAGSSNSSSSSSIGAGYTSPAGQGTSMSTSSSYRGGSLDESTAKRPLSEVEIVTSWAVLVGKFLHSRVLAMDDLALRQIMLRRRTKMTSKLEAFHLRTSVQRRARTIVEKAQILARALANEPVDRFDAEWTDDRLLTYLFTSEYVDTFLILASTTRRLLASQPMVARVQAPCRVFGDIHGQLRDLLLLLHVYGMPSQTHGPAAVFNGDFVDRGAHQLEVIGLLFALKVALPDRIWLVRGNHEDRTMNERYGFEQSCKAGLGETWGPNCYEHIHKAFDQLPLACVIEDVILVVHGGIGDGRWTLNDLENVRRPLGEQELAKPRNGWLTNILWSDPIMDNKSLQEGMYGVHPSPRRTGEQQVVEFGWNVTKSFCARNGLSLILRSHQSRVGSLGFDVMHDESLVRVFSARDYEDHENDGAVILVRPSKQSLWPLLVRPQVLGSVCKLRRHINRGTASVTPVVPDSISR